MTNLTNCLHAIRRKFITNPLLLLARTIRNCSAQSIPVCRMFVSGCTMITYARIDSSVFAVCFSWICLQLTFQVWFLVRIYDLFQVRSTTFSQAIERFTNSSRAVWFTKDPHMYVHPTTFWFVDMKDRTVYPYTSFSYFLVLGSFVFNFPAILMLLLLCIVLIIQ